MVRVEVSSEWKGLFSDFWCFQRLLSGPDYSILCQSSFSCCRVVTSSAFCFLCFVIPCPFLVALGAWLLSYLSTFYRPRCCVLFFFCSTFFDVFWRFGAHVSPFFHFFPLCLSSISLFQMVDLSRSLAFLSFYFCLLSYSLPLSGRWSANVFGLWSVLVYGGIIGVWRAGVSYSLLFPQGWKIIILESIDWYFGGWRWSFPSFCG